MPTGKGPIRTALEDFLETFGFDNLTAQIVKFVRESDEVEFVVLLDNIMSVMLDFVKDDKELSKLFGDLRTRKHQVGAALLSSMGQSVVGGVTGSLLGSLLAKPTMALNAKIRPALPDPQAMLKVHYLKLWDRNKLNAQLALHGFADGYIADTIEANKNRLDAPQLIQLMRRYPEFSRDLDTLIKARGWADADLDWLSALTLNHPSPQDIISFAVRETFNDDQVRRLDLDANFPEQARVEAEKGGLAPGWFKHYWRAHWQLPPATMGFEFFHRYFKPNEPNYFSREDLGSLLTALDIAPTWHDKMLGLSNNLLTRVDLRRVWKAGAPGIDDQFVYDEYRRSGYDDMRAKAILWWLKWENNKEELDLTKGEVHKAYVKGILKYKEASEALKAAEPNEQDRKFLLSLWDMEIKENENDAQIDLIKSEYVDGQYPETEMIRRLSTLGLSTTQQSTLTIQFNIARRKAIKHLTRTEIELLYENNQIDIPELKTRLDANGYIEPELSQMIFIITLNVNKKKQKELEEAQKEQERLLTASATTAYQQETADVNVQIAEMNAQIAELKLTAAQAEDEELTTEIGNTVLEIKKDIAFLNVSKAQIALRYREEIRGVIG